MNILGLVGKCVEDATTKMNTEIGEIRNNLQLYRTSIDQKCCRLYKRVKKITNKPLDQELLSSLNEKMDPLL